MDIVIPFIHSRNRDVELEFAQRSFCKHLQGMQAVWVIGDKPSSHIFDFTCHIPTEQKYYHSSLKENEIRNKLLQACDTDHITDPFLYANDDHFILRDFNINEFPYYHMGMHYPEKEIGLYAETIRNTRRLLGQFLFFDVHCPMIIHKQSFKSVFENLSFPKFGYCLKSVYINRTEPYDSEFKYCTDLKIKNPTITYEQLQNATRGRDWFSIDEHTFIEPVQKFLHEKYTSDPTISNLM